MFNRKLRIGSGKSQAFTLVELLIVIGIIALLVGIVVPTATRVRIAGQRVATQNTINRIVQGCQAYFQDFNAYPGPFAEGQLAPAGGLPINLQGTANPLQVDTGGTLSPFARVPTSSENLFLGLCGGLRVNTVSATTTFIYDRDMAIRGRGPGWLNPGTSKKSSSYFELAEGDIATSSDFRNPLITDASTLDSFWWPPAGAGGVAYGTDFVGDSPIFEFMDRFSKPRPILYMRAVRGVTRTGTANANVTGFIFDRNFPNVDESSPYQYDPRKIQWTYSDIGKNRDGSSRAGNTWTADEADYSEVKDDATGNPKFNKGNERYFVNEQTSTGNSRTMNDPSKYLVPQHKDEFILISAGPDGLYGTADDIRN